MILETFLVANTTILATKMIYTNIDKVEDVKKNIVNNGIYHVTTSEAADKIMESGHIRPSSNMLSMGSKKCFFFAGMPSHENLATNVASESNKYEFSAIKVDLDESNISKFKVRKYSDNAIVCKGKCDLEQNKVRKVQLVLDLNEKGEVYTREKTTEEIEKGDYVASKELVDKLALKENKLTVVENMGKAYLREFGNLFRLIKEIPKIILGANNKKMVDNNKEKEVGDIKSNEKEESPSKMFKHLKENVLPKAEIKYNNMPEQDEMTQEKVDR